MQPLTRQEGAELLAVELGRNAEDSDLVVDSPRLGPRGRSHEGQVTSIPKPFGKRRLPHARLASELRSADLVPPGQPFDHLGLEGRGVASRHVIVAFSPPRSSNEKSRQLPWRRGGERLSEIQKQTGHEPRQASGVSLW